ncbi:hypothetical protein [Chitinophaga sp. 22620]|uniref:hypothetical protein n=1 Tax=Chitinophaga sp. 22620 TaxID=3453952 RepID=UPI003F87FC27
MKRVILFFLCIHGSLAICAQTITSNLFEGFKFMNLPRDHVPVGALWNVEAGAIGDGAPQNQIKTSTSVYRLDLYLTKSQSAKLELGILQFLQAGGKYEALSTASVVLNKMEIVTLNSLDILKNFTGQQILYEAIKAEEITIVVEKEKTIQAKAELRKIFETVDLGSQAANGNKVEFKATGMNLYLAYRVIQVEKGTQAQKKLHFESQSYSSGIGLTISSRYEANTNQLAVQICPCQIIGCMLEKEKTSNLADKNQLLDRCAAEVGFDLTVIMKDKINMETGKPKEYIFKIKSSTGNSIHNYNQPLYNIPTSQGLEVAYLNVEKLIFEVLARTEKTYLIRMLHRKSDQKVNLITYSFKFRNIAPKDVAGW